MNKKLLLLPIMFVFMCTTHIVGVDLVNKLTELQGVLTQLDGMLPKKPAISAFVYAEVDPVLNWTNWLKEAYKDHLGDENASLFQNKVPMAQFDSVNDEDVATLVGFFGKLFANLRNARIIFNKMSISTPKHDTLNFLVRLGDDLLGDPINSSNLEDPIFPLVHDDKWQEVLTKIGTNLKINEKADGKKGNWIIPAAKVSSGVSEASVNAIMEGYALVEADHKRASIKRVFIDRGDGKETDTWKK